MAAEMCDTLLVTAGGRQALGRQWNLETARYQRHIQLLTGGGDDIKFLARAGIQTGAKQLAYDQIIEPANDNADNVATDLGEPSFENR